MQNLNEKIFFLQAASQEMSEAAKYYESKAIGLGSKFLSKIQHSVEGIIKNPESSPIIRDNIRRRIVQQFPFGILFKTDPEEIIIIAIMHLRKNPILV